MLGYGPDGYPRVAGASKESASFFDDRIRQHKADTFSFGFPTGRAPVQPDFTADQQGVPPREHTVPPMDAQADFAFPDWNRRSDRPRPPVPTAPVHPPQPPIHLYSPSPWDTADWEKWTAAAWSDAALVKNRSRINAAERWAAIIKQPCDLHNTPNCREYECVDVYRTLHQAQYRTTATEMEIDCAAGIKALGLSTTYQDMKRKEKMRRIQHYYVIPFLGNLLRQASRLTNPGERQTLLDAAMGTANAMQVGRLNGWKVSTKSFPWMEERIHEGTSLAGPPTLGRVLESHLRHSAHYTDLCRLSQEPTAFGQGGTNANRSNNNRRRNNNNRRRNNNNQVDRDSDTPPDRDAKSSNTRRARSPSTRRADHAKWEEPSRRKA